MGFGFDDDLVDELIVEEALIGSSLPRRTRYGTGYGCRNSSLLETALAVAEIEELVEGNFEGALEDGFEDSL